MATIPCTRCWELTWALAGELGVLDRYEVLSPEPADDETLGRIHTPASIAAVRVRVQRKADR